MKGKEWADGRRGRRRRGIIEGLYGGEVSDGVAYRKVALRMSGLRVLYYIYITYC